MNHTRTQDLREAFTSIISMMLGILRAQGLRGLRHLPEIILVVFLLRSIGKRFAALMDAHAAGTLPLTPPGTAGPEWPALYSQAAAASRVRARITASRGASHRVRRQPAKPARIQL